MAFVSPMALASLWALDQDHSGPSTDPPVCLMDFGCPEMLALIRSLTDIGAMTRLLHECIAYQCSLDVCLKSLLSQHPDLDRHLLSLHRSSHLLDLARSDTGLLSFVCSTTDLANQVSRKVCELNLAQSCANCTLSRIDAIVERSHCLNGARHALDMEDFESAARFIQTFFQIDACFPDSSTLDHRDHLLDCKHQLESIVCRCLAPSLRRLCLTFTVAGSTGAPHCRHLPGCHHLSPPTRTPPPIAGSVGALGPQGEDVEKRAK